MRLIAHEQNETMTHKLIGGCLNVINFNVGKLILPECTYLSYVKVAFMEPGKFWIEGINSRIHLGNFSSHAVMIEPGSANYETQPGFMFNPKYNIWTAITHGHLLMMDEDTKCDVMLWREEKRTDA